MPIGEHTSMYISGYIKLTLETLKYCQFVSCTNLDKNIRSKLLTGSTFAKFGVFLEKFSFNLYLNLQYCWDSDDLAVSHLSDNEAVGCQDFLPDMLMQLSFLFRPEI